MRQRVALLCGLFAPPEGLALAEYCAASYSVEHGEVVLRGRQHSAARALARENRCAALEKRFAKIKPDLEQLVGQITAAMEARDYPSACLELQTLGGNPAMLPE